MKQILRVLTVLIVVSMTGSALAAPKKAKKARPAKAAPAKAAKVPVKEMTLTGTVSKEEKKSRKGTATVSYVLTDAAGNKITLPKPKAKGEGAVDLADFVDKSVTVVAKGTETKSGDKTNIRLSQLISIEAADGGGGADVEVPMDDGGGMDADF